MWRRFMERVKQVADTAIIGGGAITTPIWMAHIEKINVIVATVSGLVGLVYVSCRLYYLIKSHGKLGG